MACRSGCTGCCRGPFDITLLDALVLREGFDRLSPELKKSPLEKARTTLKRLQARWPGLQNPFLLNDLPQEEWTEMPQAEEEPCPLLDPEGRCLVYHSRPLLCRLHGLPHVDLSGDVYQEEGCTFHSPEMDPQASRELRWDFHGAFREEGRLLRLLSRHLFGRPLSDLDTFIPLALLADYHGRDRRQKVLPSD